MLFQSEKTSVLLQVTSVLTSLVQMLPRVVIYLSHKVGVRAGEVLYAAAGTADEEQRERWPPRNTLLSLWELLHLAPVATSPYLEQYGRKFVRNVSGNYSSLCSLCYFIVSSKFVVLKKV